jgi:hypothetical protein
MKEGLLVHDLTPFNNKNPIMNQKRKGIMTRHNAIICMYFVQEESNMPAMLYTSAEMSRNNGMKRKASFFST